MKIQTMLFGLSVAVNGLMAITFLTTHDTIPYCFKSTVARSLSAQPARIPTISHSSRTAKATSVGYSIVTNEPAVECSTLSQAKRRELSEKLQQMENMIDSARAASSKFAGPDDFQRLAALERQRVCIIKEFLGDERFGQYLVTETAIGQHLKLMTAALNLSPTELAEILESASDGISLDQDEVLNWIEQHRGFDAALSLEMANDPRQPVITGFMQRYGLNGADAGTVLNNIRCLETDEVTASERELALHQLHEAVPPEQWVTFSKTFQIEDSE